MLIGEKTKKERERNGWRLLLLAQNEGQFLHFITSPSVTKPATENAYMTRFYVLCRAPPPPHPRDPLSLLNPRATRKKWLEVYLLYFLIIALWCKMCRKCLRFCHLKHWRVCICIVSLESLCLVILLIAMHTVSQKSVDIGLRFCLLLCGHLYE